MAIIKGTGCLGHGLHNSTERGDERLAKVFETINEIKLWEKKKVHMYHGWNFGWDVLNVIVHSI